jgi:hypothetical protein
MFSVHGPGFALNRLNLKKKEEPTYTSVNKLAAQASPKQYFRRLKLSRRVFVITVKNICV